MVSSLYPRILAPPRGSFFLFGPRGTGKSAWLRKTFPTGHRIDLLDEKLYQTCLAEIDRFAAALRALPPRSLVMVDEVQRLPALLNEVHRFIEDRKYRFILCGSSARKFKQTGTNLLGGRAVVRFLHPLLPEELGDDFDRATVLPSGSLPVIWRSQERMEALEAYVQIYLKEEIQAESLVAIYRDSQGFSPALPSSMDR